ncbi:triphosphoribosyl-dephospho-CoA synthase [Citrobacter freundii]|uniref:triphosphoribosyl-dephospho-CoA synthase n=1 Tax=Citrobacter freundii TaxID=546 RepID=UPI0015E939FA|nr:triphosphoribosyl-dephospho-CoA synthase [Citrobacter freundii]QLS04390.1 triphosphoribosyl-dephospho-CoA synthase [Citrobacter freundii]
MKLLSPIQVEGGAEWLARTATQCLIDEARLSPKPGLVDSRGNGAHHDLSLALMERSAHSLTSTFQSLAQQSWQRPADIALRQTIGRLGREGEQQMMAATDGVNTHRGAIWALGLLVSAVAMHGGTASAQQVAATAAELAKLPDAAAPKVFSKGLRATHRYQVPGAREEAQLAFPHVMQRALPQLRLSRFNGSSETHARLDALMAIMTSLTDTCVLSRAGMEGLDAMQDGARAVLNAGGSAYPAGQAALAALDSHMLALNASPGGAADLLAATLFIDRIDSPYTRSIKRMLWNTLR